MAFKEGVDTEHVIWFRDLVNTAKGLEEQVDTGLITPDEAFAALSKVMAGMSGKSGKQAEKGAKS